MVKSIKSGKIMKLSIIIPVYKVEPYIDKCLNSVVNQTIGQEDYEIIIVDDGSPDNSILIANEYAKRFKNIKIITQANSGLSVTRNVGIENAQGEYIWCIDSDDWIELTSLQLLFPLLNGVDVVCQRKYYRNKDYEEIIISRGKIRPSLEKMVFGYYDAMAQLYIYKKAFLVGHNLTFKSGILHEDMHFTPRALYLATSFITLDTPIYHYMLRENSISTTVNPKRVMDLINTCEDMLDFDRLFVKHSDHKLWSKYVINRIVIQILHLSNLVNNDETRKSVKKFVNSNYKCTESFIMSDNKTVRLIGVISKLCGYKLHQIYCFQSKMKSFLRHRE